MKRDDDFAIDSDMRLRERIAPLIFVVALVLLLGIAFASTVTAIGDRITAALSIVDSTR